MTPDRTDANPDENAEHGVLDESGNLDTASITILGGHIAQVSVDLPVTSHDDDIDDDVVEDEVPVDEAEIRSFETIGQPFTLDGGTGAPALTYVPEPQTDPRPTVHDDVHVEHLPTGDIILEPHHEGDAASDADSHDDLEVHDAEIIDEVEHERDHESVSEHESERELGDAAELGDASEREDAVDATPRDELVVAGFDVDRAEPQMILSTDGFDPEPVSQFVLSTDVFEPEDADDEGAEGAEGEPVASPLAEHDGVDDEPADGESVDDGIVDDGIVDEERVDDDSAEGDEHQGGEHATDDDIAPADAGDAAASDDDDDVSVDEHDAAEGDVAEREAAEPELAERELDEHELAEQAPAEPELAEDEPELAEDEPALAEDEPALAEEEIVEDELAERELAGQEADGREDAESESHELPVVAETRNEAEVENPVTDEPEQNEADMSDAESPAPERSVDEAAALDEGAPADGPEEAEVEPDAEPVEAKNVEAKPATAATAAVETPATTGAVAAAAPATGAAAATGAVAAVTGPNTPAAPTTGAVPTATGAVPTTTGSIPRTRAERAATGAIGTVPLTRREVHQADEAARVGRAHATERVRTPGPDLTLTAKRSSAIDDARESPDLLTADRLLDPRQVARPEPEGLWQQLVYSMSGHRINLGDGRRARERKELDRRIATPLAGGARFVPVLSRKGGVGKTTVTSLLGMALADARDDRIIAVDANPDRGTLADRVGRPNGRTVRDLVRAHDEVDGYHDVSSIVARDATRLDVLASDSDPRVSEAFSDDDYRQVADVAAHYYSIVLTDTGTGIVHSVMEATLERADSLVVVAGLSVDEARLASETLTWLETNGYADRVRSAVVVINSARPGTPLVRESELEAHFRTRVQTVIRMPYDPRIAAGSAISFRDLQPETRLAARRLAAAVVEGLRSPVAAA